METVQRIFDEVILAGLSLTVVDGGLKIEPREKITHDLRTKLRTYKPFILEQYRNKKSELKYLIEVVGKHYKANDEEISEMFEDTLEHHSIEVAIATFRALKGRLGCQHVDEHARDTRLR